MSDLLLVGRGPSARGFSWPAPMPVMAISSGVFMVPQECPPDYFVALDTVKYFQAGLWPDNPRCWTEDDGATHWPFWADERVEKHVTSQRCKSGTYRTLPSEVHDAIPTQHRDTFQRELMANLHLFGFQPEWGDYSNVRGWLVVKDAPPNFGQTGPFGCGDINNTCLFAVQLAHRLGYRRLYFIGVDLDPNDSCHYEPMAAILRQWAEDAAAAGAQWFNLSESSTLAEFLPTISLEEVTV